MRWVLMLCLFLGWAVAQAPQITIPPVPLSSAWASVPLPDMPLDVVEHHGALWVCGSNESIARSTDGGRHWQLLARREHGQMLFSITFPDASSIAAFGTEGMRMVSRDGGTTWARSYAKPLRSLMQVEFATPTLAFAVTDQGYGISHDGGASWKLHGTGTPLLAVRDARHMAMVRDHLGAQELLTSADGGRHFDKYKFPKAADGWTTLRSTADGYVAYGYRDDHSKPVAAVFHDATGWQILPEPKAMMNNCTIQGCLASDGFADNGWAAMGGGEARYYQLPDDEAEPLTRAWAVAGDTFCKVSETMRCRTGRTPYGPAAAQAMGKVTQAPQCIKCPDPAYPRTAALVDRTGLVDVDMMLSKTGEPYDVVLISTASGSLAEAAMAAVRQWRFRPLKIDGKPRPTDVAVEVNFHFRQN